MLELTGLTKQPLRTLPVLTVLLISGAVAGCDATITTPDDPDDCGQYPNTHDEGAPLCEDTYECIDGEWTLVGNNCYEQPECPSVRPEDGTACPEIGFQCAYQEDVPCGELESVTSECTESGWRSIWPRCQPEPECPDTLPEAGTDCTGWYYAYFCQYSVACGEFVTSLTTVSCGFDTDPPTWRIDTPATCESCRDIVDPSTCAASNCQWLTPGCGDPSTEAIIDTGCYALEDCNLTGCAPDEACLPFVYNPCAGELCDACGAYYYQCVGTR